MFLPEKCVSEEELYQNYQEKALHNDSDEDADSRQPKPDNGIVVQYRPIRTSWSQLSVVSQKTRTYRQGCGSCRSALCIILTLSRHYKRSYSTYCTLSAVASWNASAPKNAVVSSLATVHTHPPTVSAFLERLVLFIREHRSILSIARVGRETVSPTHRKSPKNCWACSH